MSRKKPRGKNREQAGPNTVEPSEQKWWESLRIQDGLSIALLVAISLAYFAPIHFQGKRLYGGDTVNWKAAAESVLEYRDRTGEEPLWATDTFGGMPAFMISYRNVVPNADSLLVQLRAWLWPSSHLILLLIGVYLLVRWFTGRPGPAFLGALAFGFTTYLSLILVAGHNSKFVALAFAPWLILAFANVMKRPTLLASLLFAVVVAVNLRASHVQITYYALFGLGVAGIASARRKKKAVQGVQAVGSG